MDVKPIDYLADSKINKDRLDEECAAHPELLMSYCKLSEEAQKNLDDAQMQLDYTKAKMSSEIREDPKSFGLTVTNEAAIRNAVLLTPEYRRALQDKNEAKRKCEFMEVAVKAIERKGKALDTLSRLHGQAYFGSLGDGSAPKAERRGLERARQEVDRALQEDMNERP
jgi:hypothetical protein